MTESSPVAADSMPLKETVIFTIGGALRVSTFVVFILVITGTWTESHDIYVAFMYYVGFTHVANWLMSRVICPTCRNAK